MVFIKVENGKVESRLVSDPKIRIDTEAIAGIATLLAEVKYQLILHGTPEDRAETAISEMVSQAALAHHSLFREKMKTNTDPRGYQS